MSSPEVPAAVGRAQAAIASFENLGSELAQAAPTGGFAEVLAAVNAAVDGQGAAPHASAVPAGGPGGTTARPLERAALIEGPTGPATGNQVVGDAVGYLGVPYQWGGTSPATGFDCSGFVQHVYADLGVSLPRTSQEQATVGAAVPSLADAAPGDLLFFEPGPGGPGHVGIYLGDGQMIDAPHTGSSVRIEPVWGTPAAIRRVVPPGGTTSGGLGAVSDSPAAPAGAPGALAPLFDAAGRTYGVSPRLLAAVAKQESGFSPSAVSPAGAQGLMQLMPSTAASLGVDPWVPAQAIDGAARLLRSDLARYGGSVPLALAAYNAGTAAVDRYGGVPPYAQTQAYVNDIEASLNRTQEPA